MAARSHFWSIQDGLAHFARIATLGTVSSSGRLDTACGCIWQLAVGKRLCVLYPACDLAGSIPALHQIASIQIIAAQYHCMKSIFSF